MGHRQTPGPSASASPIALIWADAGYQGKLVDWAAALGITLQIVRKIAEQIGFVWRSASTALSVTVTTTCGRRAADDAAALVTGLLSLDGDKVGVSRWTSGTGYVIADAVRITRG